jgi:hypothetical protein
MVENGFFSELMHTMDPSQKKTGSGCTRHLSLAAVNQDAPVSLLGLKKGYGWTSSEAEWEYSEWISPKMIVQRRPGHWDPGQGLFTPFTGPGDASMLLCHLFFAYATRFTMNLQIIAENGFVSGYKKVLVREVIRMGSE